MNIHPHWLEILPALQSENTNKMLQKIEHAEKNGSTIYPPKDLRFRAFAKNPNDVKVIILGQDPYHGSGQANGLSFSVNKNVTIPPSLKNIYIELLNDLGIDTPSHGDLTPWEDQGVLLLNSILTVNAGSPASHKGLGWEALTDKTIVALSDIPQSKVFILWGKFAQNKASLIKPHNLIIQSPHPSPFSAHTGFFGSKPFSKTNDFLIKNGLPPVQWSV